MEKMPNKDELNSAIRNIINESLNNDIRETYDGRDKFGIRRYVTELIAEGHKNPKLMSYLLRYNNLVEKGAKEFMIFEQFGLGLLEFQTGNKSVKAVLESMNETIKTYGHTLVCFRLLEQCPDEYTRETVTECYNEFLAEPCDETRANLNEAMDNMFSVDVNLASSFNVALTETINNLPTFNTHKFMNESLESELTKKLNENRKEKQAQDIFKKVEKYLNEKYNNEEQMIAEENEKYSLKGIANHNGLKLDERLKAVLKSDAAKNQNLKNILCQYTEALAAGAYEERLYETLLQNTSKFDYLLPVDKMRKAIMETVESKKEEITLTKLLEMMRDNAQSYIYVELIQEDVARYVNAPNATTRVQLRNALMPYVADPFINEMINLIYSDDTLASNSISEQAMSLKEQIDIIKQNASVTNIYTPVQYIRENESIFNVHGQYYVRKNDVMYALNKKYISKLDEKFVELCHLVNDPHVQILEDKIILSGADHYATIYEGYVDINGYRESAESLRNLNEMCMKYENYDTNFYIMCSCLLENFNKIACIDFAKHITLNENPDIQADLFKIDENIFMATHNNALMKHTFYTNVNPIFCKNTLNEHMGINVSSLFSDLLPDQDKIVLQLNETKNEYEDSIKKYEDMIEQLKDAKEDANTEEMSKELDDAIADAESKLADVKTEYKEWQETTDNMTKDDAKNTEDDENVTRETSNEPIDAKDVDSYKDELSQPLTDTTAPVSDVTAETPVEVPTDATPEDDAITDDEFSAMLASDDEDDTTLNPDDEIDTDVIDNTPIADTEDDDTYVAPEFAENDDTEDDTDAEAFDTVDTDAITDTTTDADDDSIFDIDDTEDDEDDVISTDVPAEDVPSDEDILVGDSFEDETDDEATPDMTTVDAETGAEATDAFGGDVDDPLGTEKSLDTDLYNPGTETSEFNIVNVMFDGNVNDGTVNKSGEVMVLRPMVDAGGKKYVESKTIHFYLNAETNAPIIQADDAMSTAMHNAVVAAITNHPQYDEVCANGIDATNVVAPTDTELATTTDDDNWEAEYDAEGNEEDKGNFEIGDDISTITDDVPDEIDTDTVDATPSVDTMVASNPMIDNPDTDTVDDVINSLPSTDLTPDTTIDDTDDMDDDIMSIFTDLDDDTTDEPAEAVNAVAPEVSAETQTVADPVDTYTDEDGTEIEKPAPEVADVTDEPTDAEEVNDIIDDIDTAETEVADAEADVDAAEQEAEDLGLDTVEDDATDEAASDVIPENKNVKKDSKKINENRKAILGVKSTRK